MRNPALVTRIARCRAGFFALFSTLSLGACSVNLDELSIDDVDCEPSPNSRTGAKVAAEPEAVQPVVVTALAQASIEAKNAAEPQREAFDHNPQLRVALCTEPSALEGCEARARVSLSH